MIATPLENHPFLLRSRRVHFVGIGGTGMSGLAELLMNLGYEVSGSDLAVSDATERLARLGARVFHGHDSEHVRDVHVVVYSSAVTLDNPEVQAARERKVPVIRRAEMLAELMRMKYGVAVAGAHGKTTTTSLVAGVLAEGGLDPTAIVGGRVNSLGAGARLGAGHYLVAEADESDGSFLRLIPTVAVVTNIDREHLDHYGDFDAVRDAFREFINKVPFYGFCVLCADDPHVRGLIPRIERKVFTYGLGGKPDYAAREVTPRPDGMSFAAVQGGNTLGRVHLRLWGTHNVANAVAAVAVGRELGIGFARIREALESFSGIHRRFEHVGEVNGVTVVDDYGHHPTEIRATLAAARGAWQRRRIVVVFQPHRFTRTQDLLSEFFDAFDGADRVGVLPIYAAGEAPIAGVDARQIHQGIRSRGAVQAEFLEGQEEALSFLRDSAKAGDLVITLGAGDVWKVGLEFLKRPGNPNPLREGLSPGKANPPGRGRPRAAGGEAA